MLRDRIVRTSEVPAQDAEPVSYNTVGMPMRRRICAREPCLDLPAPATPGRGTRQSPEKRKGR